MNSASVTPQSLQQKWQFGVEITGLEKAWAYFTKADFPEIEFDEVEFNPAGSMFPMKAAGRAKFSDITLEKGVPQDVDQEDSILGWIKACISVSAMTGGVPKLYQKDVDLVRYDRTGKEIKRFRLFGAWVKSAKFGEGDGSSSDNEMESMTLSFQYFDTVPAILG